MKLLSGNLSQSKHSKIIISSGGVKHYLLIFHFLIINNNLNNVNIFNMLNK